MSSSPSPPPPPPPAATSHSPPPPHPHDLLLPRSWPLLARDFEGRASPCKIECDVRGLEVLGRVPGEVRGTFYRVFPDPSWPQVRATKNGELFVPVDGDGAVSAFRFKDGHVDWKHRYVQTTRYKLERRARKALFGLYRNPYTHHPCLRAALDSTANTNILAWNGRLLALKESGQAYELDPNTLETKAYNPFHMNSQTFTAHPKLDMKTGELVGFGYEANGFMTKDVCYFVLDPATGAVSKELWFEWPFVGFMHDCAMTPNYFIIYSWSFESDEASAKAGGHRWVYNPDLPVRFVVIPRAAKDASELRTFTWGAGQPGHVASAWEEDQGGKIIIQSSLVRGNDFGFFPTKGGREQQGKPASHYVKWTIDLGSKETQLQDPQVLVDMPVEFPRVDDRFLGLNDGKFRYSWICGVRLPGWDGKPPPEDVQVGLNCLIMHDNLTGKHQVYWAGWKTHVQEPVFIPRSKDAPEGDGYLMSLTKRLDLNLTEIVILDTTQFDGPPVAVVRLPLALKTGIHGNWVDEEDIPDGDKDLGSVPDVPLYE